MKILVLDGVSEKGVKILREPGFDAVVNNDKMTEEELCKIIVDYDAVIVRSASKITAKVIEAGKNLKVIGRAGVGVDNIDVPAATERGIVVVNAPDGNTIAATEQTIGLMLALARNIPQAHANLKEGRWMRKEFTGVELRNKTLGIIGLGRIGMAVARRAQALEMKTIGYDPFVSAENAAAQGVTYKSLEEIWAESDFISLHIPKTKESLNMINKDTYAKMKDGVRIVNVARGGIVNEQDLYEAVKSGKVAGAALDVFEAEPTTESPLFELDNVVVNPHLGASTREAQVNVALDVAEEMVRILQGEMPRTAVNLPAVKPDVLAAIKPYLKLVEKLGKFQAQLAAGPVDSVKVIYSGDLAKTEVAPLTTALMKGLLDPILEEAVNYVNAPLLAKARGIKIEESKIAEESDYTELITVQVKAGDIERTVSGTLFGEDDPRIVMIDGYRIDIHPEGHILVVPHQDKPRIIGPVANLIGAHDINIAGMQVGRKAVGGKAIMMLAVDAPVPEETLAEIAKVDGVYDVKMVSL
jgi:D-3-phosphoglycerate dehydrogenase